MATIFPGSASVGQIYNGYTFDGTAWNINGIDLTENYLEESSASTTYQTKLTAGSGLSLNGSTLGVNPGAMLNTIVDGTSGNSYGLVGTSTYLDVKDTNGYNKEIELDIAAVESQLVTDGFLKNSSASGTYLTQTSASTTYLPLSAASANQIIYKNSSNVATGSSGLNYDGVSLKVNGNLESVYSNGDEGGEIFLKKAATNTTLSDGVTLDIHQNRLRIFETTGNNRGAYIDMASLPNGVNTNLVPGINQVIPTSVSVGSGSGTVAAGGTITFSGATSISINGCFSATYDNYRIVIDSYAASVDGTNPYFRVRSSGSDISLTNYYHAGRRMISWGGASSDMLSAGVNYFPGVEANNDTNTYRNYVLEVQNPFKSTNVTMLFNTSTQVGGTYYGTGIYAGMYRANTSIDGISLINSTATTGTIRVYGYNNGGA